MFDKVKKQFNIKVKKGTVIAENNGNVVISGQEADNNGITITIIGIIVGIIGIIVTIIGIFSGYISFPK